MNKDLLRTPVDGDPSIKSVLTIRNLHISYFARGSEIKAVRGIDLTVHAGETLALVGESGSGKSSVAFASMRGLDAAGRMMGGSIHFHDMDVMGLGPLELRALQGARIAMVYQDPQTALNPAFRIGDQIAEVVSEHTGVSGKQARQRVIELLEEVNLPDPAGVYSRYPHELSGGQQQRVLIAMAFACNPELLILDEPTTGLDVTTEAHILDLVAKLKETHSSAILYITHNLGVVARFCHRVAVMYAGEIIEEGPVSRVFTNPSHPYTQSLLTCIPRLDLSKRDRPLNAIEGRLPSLMDIPSGCIFAPRCRHRQDQCVTSSVEPHVFEEREAGFVRCLRWHELPDFRFERHQRGTLIAESTETPDPLLVLGELRCYYRLRRSLKDFSLGYTQRHVHAVDNVDLTLAPGETVAIVGESGCGKTTLGRTVVGLQPATGGDLVFEGDPLPGMAREREPDLRRRVQIIFQNPDATLNPQKSVGETIRRPLELFDLIPAPEQEIRVADLLKSVNLPPSYALRYPHELSGGEKQRVAIARAFAAEPELIVCDEPLSALDVSVQAAILNLLVDLQKTSNTAYLFISHDLSVVRYLSDQVAVMYMGRIVEQAEMTNLFTNPQHPYTQALLESIPRRGKQPKTELKVIAGSVPNPFEQITGCPFHPRCEEFSDGRCNQGDPPILSQLGTNQHVACFIREKDKIQ